LLLPPDAPPLPVVPPVPEFPLEPPTCDWPPLPPAFAAPPLSLEQATKSNATTVITGDVFSFMRATPLQIRDKRACRITPARIRMREVDFR
jgi:hypothetical protein